MSSKAEMSKIQNALFKKAKDATELKSCKRVYVYFALHVVMIKTRQAWF